MAAIGEGWACFVAELDGKYLVIMDSGSMADFLDEEDQWMAGERVHTFESEAERDRFVEENTSSRSRELAAPRRGCNQQPPRMTRYVAAWGDVNEPVLLGRFELVGDRVEAKYFSDSFKEDVEESGVVERLYPSDGRAFLDALPLAFANSSRVSVTDYDPTGRRSAAAVRMDTSGGRSRFYFLASGESDPAALRALRETCETPEKWERVFPELARQLAELEGDDESA